MKRHAFTLIELLVVISILGVLFAVTSYTIGSVSARSRDNTRKQDLLVTQTALEKYFTDQRSYPLLDTQSIAGQPAFDAAWQLSSTVTCTHSSGLNIRLNSYLTIVPRDPQSADLTQVSCAAPLGGSYQQGRYLYITRSSTGNPPTSGDPATGYGLLATLERPNSADLLSASNNPFVTSTTTFGSWYAGFGSIVNPNYMISGGSSR